jgi:hypothetical protein
MNRPTDSTDDFLSNPLVQARWHTYLQLRSGGFSYPIPSLSHALENHSIRGRDHELLKHATNFLGDLGDKRAVPHLARAMKHLFWIDKMYAVRALGKIGGTEAASVLVGILTRKKRRPAISSEDAVSSDLKEEAGHNLAGMGEPAIPLLMDALLETDIADKDRESISGLLVALCKAAPPRLHEALRDENIDVRISAVQTIAKIGHTDSVDAMLALFSPDEKGNMENNLRVLCPAAEFLGRVAGMRAFSTRDLDLFLANPNSSVRTSFFNGLREHEPQGIRDLMELHSELLAQKRGKPGVCREVSEMNAKELYKAYKTWVPLLHEKLAKENMRRNWRKEASLKKRMVAIQR